MRRLTSNELSSRAADCSTPNISRVTHPFNQYTPKRSICTSPASRYSALPLARSMSRLAIVNRAQQSKQMAHPEHPNHSRRNQPPMQNNTNSPRDCTQIMTSRSLQTAQTWTSTRPASNVPASDISFRSLIPIVRRPTSNACSSCAGEQQCNAGGSRPKSRHTEPDCIVGFSQLSYYCGSLPGLATPPGEASLARR